MRIGIDLDGVVWDIYSQILKEWSEKFGEDLTGFTDPRIEQVTEVSPEIVREVFHDAEFYYDMPLLPGVVQEINHLAQHGFEIFFITARPAPLFGMTWEKLSKMFRFPFVLSFNPDKKQAVEQYDLDYFVEDQLDNGYQVATKAHGVYIMNSTYNQGEFDYLNMVRVDNWEQISRDLGVE